MDSEMDTARGIEQWNARWMIVAGSAVCTSCMKSQALADCGKQFSHAHECNAELAHLMPWIALHYILDGLRG